MVCSQTINHFSSISVINEIYRFKLVNFLPIFGLQNFLTKPGATKLGLHKVFINTHIVFKFQLCTSSGFGIISELITFQAKNCRFLCFLCHNSRSRDLGSPKSAHMTLSFIVMSSPNFNILDFTVC